MTVEVESELVLQGLRRIRDELSSDGSGHVVILTGGLAEELERNHGMHAPVFTHAMTALVRSGTVVGKPLIGAPTNWHVTNIK